MRVLCVETLQFKEFHSLPDDDYATLSHVWGSNEISYEDISRTTLPVPVPIEHKHEASAKLIGCREQARKDGIKYLWIDTCCINQPNHSELSEAINSMFHWYQKSKVCYVYLADIGVGDDLAASRWFLRGWTLQELIAPQDVRFFNQDWQPIGNKKDLALTLSKITRIPQDFLMGRDLEEASIAQRMSWASKRETSKEEDLAYCLFGIFDIQMPLLYGERLHAAFRRLQLEILQH
ncbi:heterokaryon incompatibility protein-domain-containing protein [Boeremia exigua]|uniref:heterokaryon incompatibility protein-domain-containing protein n=1 Tax=Boeremia exigua TaxID=749465 RepID=UPI001E8D609E|nr:heterokaryon incompatibility protein-domain-containing protein [Boeremia exigua]KAH6612423.1 heterokaryon incompatibility protein-domain-containing protein [Boeremia exigua]